MAQLPDPPGQSSPIDGVTRISIPRPFSDWSTPVVFLAIAANVATGSFLRSKPFFQAATTLEQVALAVACVLATTLPFGVAYGAWRLLCRRRGRAVRQWESGWTDDIAAERILGRMSTGDMWDRCRVFSAWIQEHSPAACVYVVHWHDEVAAVDPVNTPFEPRPIESDDPLPEAGELFGDSAASGDGPDGGVSDSSKTDGSKRFRRTMALLGITMIAASILWVAAELAQSPRIQWLTDMLLPLTVTVLTGITIWGLRGLLIRDRWLLVPGGVVLRRSRGARAGVDNLLFDRRKSVACVLELNDADWLVTLRSGQLLAQRRVTPVQLQRFLRTWLSSVPPPVDRLVDLE